jgi:hypothetical protein
VHVMRSEVLPLFDLVRDPAALCAAIEAGSFPCLRATEVDLFLWSGHADPGSREDSRAHLIRAG